MDHSRGDQVIIFEKLLIEKVGDFQEFGAVLIEVKEKSRRWVVDLYGGKCLSSAACVIDMTLGLSSLPHSRILVESHYNAPIYY